MSGKSLLTPKGRQVAKRKLAGFMKQSNADNSPNRIPPERLSKIENLGSRLINDGETCEQIAKLFANSTISELQIGLTLFDAEDAALNVTFPLVDYAAPVNPPKP